MSLVISHRSGARAVVYTHSSPEGKGSTRVDLSPFITSVATSKHISTEGKWSISLTPGLRQDRLPSSTALDGQTADSASIDFLRFLQPNDLVNIYLTNGTPSGPANPQGGWHRQVFGYIDSISESVSVAAEGAQSKSIVIQGTDHTKAYTKSSTYFNAALDPDKAFGSSIAGLKIARAGLPILGTPADMVRFWLLSNIIFGGQYEFPKAYVRDLLEIGSGAAPSLSPIALTTVARALRIDAGAYAVRLLGGSSVAATIAGDTTPLLESLLLNKSREPVLPSARGASSGLSDMLKSLILYLYKDLSVAPKTDKEIIEDLQSSMSLPYILDLSYIEDPYVRGFKQVQSIHQSGVSLYNAISSMSDPLMNELIFDLRPINRGSFEYVYAADETGLNFDGTAHAPLYAPAVVLREYPFSTGVAHAALPVEKYSDGKLDVLGLDMANILDGHSGPVGDSKPTTTPTESVDSGRIPPVVEDLLRMLLGEAAGHNEQTHEALLWVVRNRLTFVPNSDPQFGAPSISDTLKRGSFAVRAERDTTSASGKVRPGMSLSALTEWANKAYPGSSQTPLNLIATVFAASGSASDTTNGALYFFTSYNHPHNRDRYIDYDVVSGSSSIAGPQSLDDLQDSARLYSDILIKQRGSPQFRASDGKNQALPFFQASSNASVTLPANLKEVANKVVPLGVNRNATLMPAGALATGNEERMFTVHYRKLDGFVTRVVVPTVTVSFINPENAAEILTVTGSNAKLLCTTWSATGAVIVGTKVETQPAEVAGIDPLTFLFVAPVHGTDITPLFRQEPVSSYIGDLPVAELESGEAEGGSAGSLSTVIDLTNGVFFRNRSDTLTDTPTDYYTRVNSDSQRRRVSLELTRYFKGVHTYLTEYKSAPGLNRRYLDSVSVRPREVISMELSRGDANTINLTSVYPAQMGTQAGWQEALKLLPLVTEISFRRNGLRVMEQDSDWYQLPFSSQKALEAFHLEIGMLSDMFHQHNQSYYSGSMTLAGRPDIRVGYRLDYDTKPGSGHSAARDLSFYVEGVEQRLNVDASNGAAVYLTVVTLTRGQPTQENERLPYVPPNWYFKFVLGKPNGWVYRDVAISEAAYRSTSDFYLGIQANPEKLADYTQLPEAT